MTDINNKHYIQLSKYTVAFHKIQQNRIQENITEFGRKPSFVVAVIKIQSHLFLLQLVSTKYNHTSTFFNFKNDTSTKLLKFQTEKSGKLTKR